MKAIVRHEYGSPDVLKLEEVPKPTPKDNEVLIQIHAASVNPVDWRLLRADPFLVRLFAGLLKPKHQILGADIAGRVEAVGRDVTQFQTGDEVFGDIFGCGLGGFAEYVCVPEQAAVVKKPVGMTFEEAAAVPLAALTALQGLRDKGKIQSGHKVLVHGASGGVGTFAVQIVKSFGAEVTAVCSTRNVDMVRSIGADHLIDYTKEDFTNNAQGYDLILAVAGNRSMWEYKRALRPKGRYVMIGGGSMAQFLQVILLGPWISMIGSQTMTNFTAKGTKQDLASIKEFLEAGKVVPVIDRHYLLDEVAESLRYLEGGHARGKVVITVEHK